jgi:hypothetical protein
MLMFGDCFLKCIWAKDISLPVSNYIKQNFEENQIMPMWLLVSLGMLAHNRQKRWAVYAGTL